MKPIALAAGSVLALLLLLLALRAVVQRLRLGGSGLLSVEVATVVLGTCMLRLIGADRRLSRFSRWGVVRIRLRLRLSLALRRRRRVSSGQAVRLSRRCLHDVARRVECYCPAPGDAAGQLERQGLLALLTPRLQDEHLRSHAGHPFWPINLA